MVDAKSVYDTSTRNTAGGQRDRRTAIELAVIRDSLQESGGVVRWIPHPRMPADIMNKVDVSKGNEALSHLLRTGYVRLTDEEKEMQSREEGTVEMGRSKAASRRVLENEENHDP